MEKTINIFKTLSEVIVVMGYGLALIPFVYLYTMWVVIPLTIVNVVLAYCAENKKVQQYTLINVMMAFLAIIPLFGYIPRIAGIIISVLAIVELMRDKQC